MTQTDNEVDLADDLLISPALHLRYIRLTLDDIAQGADYTREVCEAAALDHYGRWAQQYGAGSPSMLQRVHQFESELAVVQTAINRFEKVSGGQTEAVVVQPALQETDDQKAAEGAGDDE